MKNTIVNYGLKALLAGLLLFGLSLFVSLYLELGYSEITGYAGIILALSMVYFGIKAFRDKVNDGQVSFGKALMVGLGISAFGAIGIAVADMIYTGVIDPDWAANYAAEMTVEGQEPPPALSTPILGVFMFFISFTVGAIISLISSLILKKQN